MFKLENERLSSEKRETARDNRRKLDKEMEKQSEKEKQKWKRQKDINRLQANQTLKKSNFPPSSV